MNPLESRLKSVEYHLEVATGGAYYPAVVVNHAQADLANIDVPYLLGLVRAQAAQIIAQSAALDTIGNVVERWERGHLTRTEDGTVWQEPLSPLPSGTDEIRSALAEGMKDEEV